MKSREPTDASWVVLFDAQIKANSRHFLSIAFGILREGGAAEDACQQAFLKAWERRSDLRDVASLKGWLTTLVVNESLQHYRRRTRERQRQSVDSPDPDAGPAIALALETARETEHSPAGVDRRESVLLALDSLPESERTVIVLRIMRGMSGSETMAVVGCSEGEVSRLLHRGLARLKPVLTHWADDPER